MDGTPFSNSTRHLGQDRLGRELRLVSLNPSDAHELAHIFASIDPWKTLDWPTERLEKYLADSSPGAPRFLIDCDGEAAGAVGLETAWLEGVYLRFLGLVPNYQNAGIGAVVMTWFEREARGSYRNLWVCVSAFNIRALAFYERHGYARAALFDDLIMEGEDEILL